MRGLDALLLVLGGAAVTARPTHGYAAFKPCGCLVACTVDDPAHRKEVARFVAKIVQDGLRLERMEIEAIRPLIRRCRCGKTA